MEFKKYRKTAILEMRPLAPDEIGEPLMLLAAGVSISQVDLLAGSPKAGGMIARGAKPEDMWLVAGDFFKANYEQA